MTPSCNMKVFFCTILFFVAVIKISLAIRCYECNSKSGEGCGDPFIRFNHQMVNCTGKSYTRNSSNTGTDFTNGTHNVCRKNYQIVGSARDTPHIRMQRTCGWIDNRQDPEKDEQCVAKVGTYNVWVTYCTCRTDGCNSAEGLPTSQITVWLLFTFVLTLCANINVFV